MSEFKNLTLDVADGIAVLAISRPAALNALNSETLDELNVCLGEIEKNDDIKVVILTGGPDKKGNEFKSFVAGADIAEMVNFTLRKHVHSVSEHQSHSLSYRICVRLQSLLSTVLHLAADARSL